MKHRAAALRMLSTKSISGLRSPSTVTCGSKQKTYRGAAESQKLARFKVREDADEDISC